MSVTVLVTQARSSLPGRRPWVELPRFLVRSFQFSLGIYSPFSMNTAACPCSISRCRAVPMFVGGKILRSLEAVSDYAQHPYFGFKCLPGNAQLNCGTGWTTNHAFGFLECGFEHFSFVLGKVSNEWNRRHSCLGSDVLKP